MFGFLFLDIAAAVRGILFGRQVGQGLRFVTALGQFLDTLECRNAPAATRTRPQAFGHPTRLLNLFALGEMPEFPQRHMVTVADVIVPIHAAIIGPQGGSASCPIIV